MTFHLSWVWLFWMWMASWYRSIYFDIWRDYCQQWWASPKGFEPKKISLSSYLLVGSKDHRFLQISISPSKASSCMISIKITPGKSHWLGHWKRLDMGHIWLWNLCDSTKQREVAIIQTIRHTAQIGTSTWDDKWTPRGTYPFVDPEKKMKRRWWWDIIYAERTGCEWEEVGEKIPNIFDKKKGKQRFSILILVRGYLLGFFIRWWWHMGGTACAV